MKKSDGNTSFTVSSLTITFNWHKTCLSRIRDHKDTSASHMTEVTLFRDFGLAVLQSVFSFPQKRIF